MRKTCGNCEHKVGNAISLPSGRISSGEWICRKFRDSNGRAKRTTGIVEIEVLDRIDPLRLDECERPWCTSGVCDSTCGGSQVATLSSEDSYQDNAGPLGLETTERRRRTTEARIEPERENDRMFKSDVADKILELEDQLELARYERDLARDKLAELAELRRELIELRQGPPSKEIGDRLMQDHVRTLGG